MEEFLYIDDRLQDLFGNLYKEFENIGNTISLNQYGSFMSVDELKEIRLNGEPSMDFSNENHSAPVEKTAQDDRLQDLFGNLYKEFENIGNMIRLNQYGSFMSVVSRPPFKKIPQVDELKEIRVNGELSMDFSNENHSAPVEKTAQGTLANGKFAAGLPKENTSIRQGTMSSPKLPGSVVSRVVDDTIATVQLRDSSKGIQDSGKLPPSSLTKNLSAYKCSPTTGQETIGPLIPPSNDVLRIIENEIVKVGDYLKENDANDTLPMGISKDSTNHHRIRISPVPPSRNVSTVPNKKLYKSPDFRNRVHYMQPMSSSMAQEEVQRIDTAYTNFRAALKYLRAASLLERLNSEDISSEEAAEPVKLYTEAARQCESCAITFDSEHIMAFAALAYKCTEVAHFKVAFLKHINACEDTIKVGAIVHMVKQDDLNDQGMLDKPTLANDANSLQTADNRVTSACHRPTKPRWLEKTTPVIRGFEASRKAQNAFAAASNQSGKNIKGLSSVKDVLDYNFHSIEELLRLLRLLIESSDCKFT